MIPAPPPEPPGEGELPIVIRCKVCKAMLSLAREPGDRQRQLMRHLAGHIAPVTAAETGESRKPPFFSEHIQYADVLRPLVDALHFESDPAEAWEKVQDELLARIRQRSPVQ